MLWIIASIPFWLVGTVIICASSLGLFLHLRRGTMDPASAFAAAAALTIVAGVFFIIAAKVAGA